MDWDTRYAEPGFAYGTEPNDFLKEAVRYLPEGGRVLSVAEGEGRNAVFLARQGFRVTGVDASRTGLEKARGLAAEAGVDIECLCRDLADYEPEAGAWDGVVSIFCHLPAAIRAQLNRKLVQALRPGGVLILEAYTPEQLRYGTGGPPSAELLADQAQLEQELAGLVWLHARSLTRPVVEGRYHTGEAAVVQLVGRKPGPQSG